VKRVVVPIDLGGSPIDGATRPPRRPPPTAETVQALIEHYATERAPAGGVVLEPAFFRGGLPSAELLAACEPHPVRVACSPADLSRDGAAWLRDRGVSTIELDVRTFDTPTLRALRRGYSGAQARAILSGLGALGLRRGVTLAPGLPGTSHASALADAGVVAGDGAAQPLAEFVRLLPALAYEGTDLAQWAVSGRWTPMSIAEAVTTCEAMEDRLRDAGVPVARMGQQPGADVPDTHVAGPWHPNLRSLVEGRRFRRRMAAALADLPRSAPIELRVHPKDLSWAKGASNTNVRALRAALSLPGLRVSADPSVPRGSVRVAG